MGETGFRVVTNGCDQAQADWRIKYTLARNVVKRCENERPDVNLSGNQFNRNVKETEHFCKNIVKAKIVKVL